MVMIADKLRVLWHVLIGGVEKHPHCSLHTVLQAASYRVNGHPKGQKPTIDRTDSDNQYNAEILLVWSIR